MANPEVQSGKNWVEGELFRTAAQMGVGDLKLQWGPESEAFKSGKYSLFLAANQVHGTEGFLERHLEDVVHSSETQTRLAVQIRGALLSLLHPGPPETYAEHYSTG